MAAYAEATAGNAWVSSYLDALLSYGLSSEYAQAPKEGSSAKAPDADRALYSRYYLKVIHFGWASQSPHTTSLYHNLPRLCPILLQSLLNLDEEALKNAWSKVGKVPAAGSPPSPEAVP